MRRLFIIVLSSLLALMPLHALGQEAEKASEREAKPGVPVERGGGLLGKGKFVLEPGLQYSHYSKETLSISGFTIFEAILIGRVEAKDIKRDIFIPSLTARLGLKKLELSVRLPWIYRRDETIEQVEDERVEVAIDDRAIGDLEGHIYYPIAKEKGSRPDIIANLGVKTPTGRDPYGLETGVVKPGTAARATEFPTGTGHWGVSGGLVFVKTSDPLVLSLNLGYFYNIKRDVGEQNEVEFGDIDPGDSIEAVLGALLALNDRTSVLFSYDFRYTGESEQNGEKIIDSNVNAQSFTVGVNYALSQRRSWSFSVGMGLTEDASEVTLNFRFPFSFFF